MIYQPNQTLTILQWTNLMYLDMWDIWCIYKPHNISSTQWDRANMIDRLISQASHHPLVSKWLKAFGVKEELGMVTRLDHETAGLLRFAKDQDIKQRRIQDQKLWLIEKIYHADVTGWLREPITVSTPIMHHRDDDRRMIVIHSRSDEYIGRSSPHQVSTLITPIEIDGSVTHIQAIIHQWCRHQIRVHCADISTPIVGDTLYHKSASHDWLHLWSLGINREGNVGLVIVDRI